MDDSINEEEIEMRALINLYEIIIDYNPNSKDHSFEFLKSTCILH